MKLPRVVRTVAAVSFAFATGAHASDVQIERIGANTVNFDGLINRDSKDALPAAFDDRVTTLRITSPGGDLWPAS